MGYGLEKIVLGYYKGYIDGMWYNFHVCCLEVTVLGVKV